MTLYDNPSKFVPLSDDSALSDILQLTAVTIMTRVNLAINNNWSHTKFDSIQNTFFHLVSKSGEHQFSNDCIKAHLSSFARSSLSTAIPVGGHGEGERVDGVVGEGGGGEDDDVEVVEDDDRDDKEGGDGDEEDWVGGFLGDGGCSSF